MTMEWQTKENATDCGIFLMRHMETYKGDRKSWDTKFKNEGVCIYIYNYFLSMQYLLVSLIFFILKLQIGQYNQMIRLRAKYNTAILSSNLNARKDDVLTEAHELFNEAAEKKLLQLVIENSAKNRAQGILAKTAELEDKTETATKKNVTFAKDLETEFQKTDDF